MRFFKFFIFIILISSCSKDNDSPTSINDEIEIEKRQRSWIDLFTPITPCEALMLTFAIEGNCAGSPYAVEILNAIQAYNNTPTSINFTQIADPNTAHLVFNCVTGNNCAEAIASAPFPVGAGPDVQTTLPSGGTIGGQIDLDINWSSCPCIEVGNCNITNNEPACMFQRTVMHEIGHILGFSHNDGKSGTHIEGTPDSNDVENSIFNSGPITNENCDWCTAPCIFTSSDIIALQSIYPEVIAECECPELFDACACEESISITLPSIWENEPCIPKNYYIQVCVFGRAGDPEPNVQYEWSSTGSIVVEDDFTDIRCVHISTGNTGGTISVWATNDECGENTTNRVIVVCDDTGGGGGPGPHTKPMK